MAAVIARIELKGIGYTPVVINEQGAVMREVLLWLVHLKRRENLALSTMERNAAGLVRFHDFWMRYAHVYEKEPDALLRGFWKSMCSGDPELGWERIEIDTAKSHLTSVNHFADWLSDTTGAKHPNQLTEKPMSWIAQVCSQMRRSQSDLLAHLMPATMEGKRIKIARSFEVPKSDTRRHPRSHRPAKVFAFEDYTQLIKHEEEPRNLLLWLLLGAGGLRVSEPLHLFPADILFQPATQEARVKCVDPQSGPIATRILGREVVMTRKEYLKQKYDLVPRDTLPDSDIMWAGWKGMKMTNPEEGFSEVIWIHSIFGQMMWAAHVAYLKQRMALAPKHPWYFVNLKRNVGAPLTISNVEGLLQRTCERLHLKSPHNPHALRHMFGDVLANQLEIPIQDIQVGMRHSSILSTMIYTEPSPSSVRKAIAAHKRQRSD